MSRSYIFIEREADVGVDLKGGEAADGMRSRASGGAEAVETEEGLKLGRVVTRLMRDPTLEVPADVGCPTGEETKGCGEGAGKISTSVQKRFDEAWALVAGGEGGSVNPAA